MQARFAEAGAPQAQSNMKMGSIQNVQINENYHTNALRVKIFLCVVHFMI